MSKQSELRDEVRDILFTSGASNSSYITDEKLMPLIITYTNKQVEEASEQAFKRGYISGGIDELNRLGTGDGIIWSGDVPVKDRINKLKEGKDGN